MSAPKGSEAEARARAAWRKLLRSADGADSDLMEQVLEGGADAAFVVDPERNVLFFNRRAEELTGLRREDVLGRHCLAGFRCEHCLEECQLFKRGRIHRATVELRRPDGRRLAVRKDAAVLRDRHGQVIGAIESFREAEPERGAGAAAGGFHGAELVMAALGRGLVFLDDSFALAQVSSAFAQMLGETASSLEGRPAAACFGKELLGAESPFRKALEAGERREGWRATLSPADGSLVPVSVSGAPLRCDDACGGGCPAKGYVLVARPESGLPLEGGHRSALAFEGMVGASPRMVRLFELIEQLRDSDATVLLTGESGTGKELVARAIHSRSPRANRPFVGLNCAALPENLLESELFGHARGSFTGAVRDKAGRFEAVEEGTLFLDEVGDLPLPLQAKLLRVLQERTFERVGENAPRTFRGRVLAATNIDLQRAVAARTFREDLFYRLNVVQIRIPPLRERREDIEPLAAHLLAKIGARRTRSLRLSPSALRALFACDWPGNVRQLENALEYATAICGGQTIHVDDLPPEIVKPSAEPRQPVPYPLDPSPPAADLASAYPSEKEIVEALRKTRRRRGEAAKLLGVSRTTLWRRMRELGLC